MILRDLYPKCAAPDCAQAVTRQRTFGKAFVFCSDRCANRTHCRQWRHRHVTVNPRQVVMA